jgi:hypothetical protein
VKSDDVRREYVTNEDNAPYDVIFKPVNRDIAFRTFYNDKHGVIDANAGIDILATSPINRPHACDGKVTTGAMADKLMFFAHSGKVTMREKFVGENGRVPDLPGAQPQFALGYTVIAPLLFVEKLQQAHRSIAAVAAVAAVKERADNIDSVKNVYSFDPKMLWHNSVYPASPKENWYVSATAAYWNLLHAMPAVPAKAAAYVRDELSELNCRYLYTTKREGPLAARDARVSYDSYKYYQVPRIRGTFVLHQLRLLVGNEKFAKAEASLHEKYSGKEVTNEQIVETFERETGRSVKAYIDQWIDRDDLPVCEVTVKLKEHAPTGTLHEPIASPRAHDGAKADAATKEGHTNGTHSPSSDVQVLDGLSQPVMKGEKWSVEATVAQNGHPYHFFTTVTIETEKEKIYRLVEIQNASTVMQFETKDKPTAFRFNSGNDIPVDRERYFTFSNFSDDFSSVLIVYGTTRQVEAQHTLALRFQKMAADRFTETMLPVAKESELTDSILACHDLVVLGNSAENELTKRLAAKLNIEVGTNYFAWQDKTYAASDDGLFIAVPNPFNPSKTVYLFVGNSVLEVYNMTKTLPRLPSWAIFKKDQVIDKGYHPLTEQGQAK